MKRSGPLKRKTPLKRTKLRRRSIKRTTQENEYNRRVKEWKLENPWCKACEAVWLECFGSYRERDCNPTDDNHHMAGREGALLLDEKWWLPVCRQCHNWIGEHSNRARELGLLAPKNL